MWTYSQSTGALTHDATPEGSGYSGQGAGLNNPAMQDDQGVGPIPAGLWRIGTAFDHPHLGPCVMLLTPLGWDGDGRGGFFIHGDNAAMDHTASHGCIILARPIREAIAASSDRQLTVIH